MPVDIDPSSPAVVSGIGASLTTSSFAPPDSSLLVATVMGGSSATISNNGSPLTWTTAVSGTVTICTAPLLVGRIGMTVTAGVGGSSSYGFKLDVMTGANLSTPVGGKGSGSSSINNATITGYTSTVAGSRGLCGGHDGNGLGLPSSTDSGAAWSGVFCGIRVAKASPTPASGTPVTFNLDAAGTGTPSWSWAAVEILPGVQAPPRAYRSTAAVHRRASW